MGQQEVLRAVEELGFTTFEELQHWLNLSTRSITSSLTRLVKWKEIFSLEFGVKHIYFSENVFNELQNERNTMD